jgi:hypothetical protein
MTEYMVRFIVGGLLVSLFAIIGDVVRPKSFAGLFGAAPSVALATLGIVLGSTRLPVCRRSGKLKVLGGIALLCYSVAVCQILMRTRAGVLRATLASLPLWLIVALGLHMVVRG